MFIIYNFAIFLYQTLINFAAFFGNEKAKLWVSGRRNIFDHIKQSITVAPLSKRGSKAQIIWIHVASLGEFEQGRPIIEALKNVHTSDTAPLIILTFFSPSGYEIRKKYPLADCVFYLPIDSRHNARLFLDLIKPDLVIFVKYEFWFHYLNELHLRNIPTLLVSAIFREKQFSKLNPYTPYMVRVLKNFKHIFLQDTPSVSLLQKQGLSNISVVGDTRIDRVMAIAAEAKRFSAIEQFIGHAPVFIGGSTWQPDEEIIISLFNDEKFKNWKFIFAPHDISPKNIERLVKLLPELTTKYSQISDAPALASTNSRILIIDNVGMLSAIYRYGRVAYIGGGFGSGIHNTLEPIAFGLPVIFGLKYKKFAEAIHLVATGGAFPISNTSDFQHIMQNLLNEQNYQKAATAAQNYIQLNQGATEQIISFIKNLKP